MATQNRSELKQYFETGDTPSSADFASLIDSTVNKLDDDVFVKNQNIGLGIEDPKNKLDVLGEGVIGENYAGQISAPANGLVIQGKVGIGIPVTNEKLTIDGSISLRELDASPKATPDFGKLYVKEDRLVSAEFNGESSYISMPSLGVAQVLDFTICLWFKVLPGSQSRHYLMDFRGDGSERPHGCGLLIDEAGNETATLGHFSSWAQNDRSVFKVNVGRIFGEWHHTVLSRKGNKLQIFLDGKMLSDQPTLGTPVKDAPITWDNDWRIGAFSANDNAGGDYWLKGSVDEVALWTRALSPDEIRNIFLAGRGFNLKNKYEDRLKSYWRMIESDQISDSRIYDQMEPGREGVLHNTDFHVDTVKALHFIDSNGNDQILGGSGSVGAGVTGSVWNQNGPNVFYDTGNVGIGTTDPDAQLVVAADGTSLLKISGDHSDYINAGLLFQANSKDANYRGLGSFYFDKSGKTEWFVGTPYTNSDQLIIARRQNVLQHQNDTAQIEHSLVSVSKQGNLSIAKKIASQGNQVQRDFITWNTTAGNSNPVHIKTNIKIKTNIMYRILVEGYNYGKARPINSEIVGYTYIEWEYPQQASAYNHTPGVSISQYTSADKFVVIKLSTDHTYFMGFSASAWFTNPTGTGFNISAEVFHQAGNL